MKEVACLVPMSWDFIPVCFMYSWINMMEYARDNYRLIFVSVRSPYMDSMRDLIVTESRKYNPDYLLWLDVDQSYPPDTPERLMKHVDEGRLVVGGVTPIRHTGQPMIYDFIPDEEHKFLYRTKNNHLHGIQKVGGMGMGGIMVHPRVYDEFLEYPFFQMPYESGYGRRAGEDAVFFKSCQKAGINVWCDYDLLYKHMATIETGIRWDKPEVH